MKPSSILSTYATAVGMAAAIMMPLCGAIVDTSSYRRGLGRVLVMLFSLGILATVFVSEENWFAISWSFAAVAFIGWFENMTLHAYLPELTNDEDTLNRYTKTFSVLSFGSMVLFLILVFGISKALAFESDEDTVDDEIRITRLSQSLAFAILAPCFAVAWKLFRSRPPTRILGPTESAWRSGFVELYRTAIKVHQHYPMLQWFFVAIAVGDAAANALLVLALTYLAEVLEFTATENGAAVLVMLLASIPGSFIASWWTKHYNPVSSAIAAVCMLITSTTLVAAILKSPDQAAGAYVLGALWGVGGGWKFTVDKMLYAMILPENRNAEFSGSYVFFRQCLAWLPPLVFTFMNEAGVSLRWGMGSVNIFFVLAALFLYFGVGIKRYDEYTKNKNENNHENINDNDERRTRSSSGNDATTMTLSSSTGIIDDDRRARTSSGNDAITTTLSSSTGIIDDDDDRRTRSSSGNGATTTALFSSTGI